MSLRSFKNTIFLESQNYIKIPTAPLKYSYIPSHLIPFSVLVRLLILQASMHSTEDL